MQSLLWSSAQPLHSQRQMPQEAKARQLRILQRIRPLESTRSIEMPLTHPESRTGPNGTPMPSASATRQSAVGTDTVSPTRRSSGRTQPVFMRVVASFGAALLALSVATTTQFTGTSTAEAAQKSVKKSTAKQAKKSKRTRKKARSGTRYNFGSWDRDTTYEGYCDNSYRIGIPTVSCQDFRRH